MTEVESQAPNDSKMRYHLELRKRRQCIHLRGIFYSVLLTRHVFFSFSNKNDISPHQKFTVVHFTNKMLLTELV